MEFITVTNDNIEKEHICCSIVEKKGENCVGSKKAWLRQNFADGLVFYRANVRGKVFIEYIPAEHAWCPISADGYMHINCFWVSGQYKGQGYANELLNHCIQDAKEKGMKGVTILSSGKKRPYLSDPGYLKYKGFRVADQADPYFILYYLPFSEDAPVPKMKECAKTGRIEEQGMVLYYTNQCPFTDKYVPLMQEAAKQHGVMVSVHKIESAEQAQNAPSPVTTYSFFYNGEYVTNEIFNEKKFDQFLQQHGL
ncbi:GNAT family N-acetyltransferase [Anaerolentibacter hominis]|uniref:GNAT family N-acetyltransferase n=1 Tax=Anaerolentibacter hominis TaxID=3079009 RepID=UPI0031B8A250